MAPSQTLKWIEQGKDPSEQNVEIEGTEPYIVGEHTASGYWVNTNRETTVHGPAPQPEMSQVDAHRNM